MEDCEFYWFYVVEYWGRWWSIVCDSEYLFRKFFFVLWGCVGDSVEYYWGIIKMCYFVFYDGVVNGFGFYIVDDNICVGNCSYFLDECLVVVVEYG